MAFDEETSALCSLGSTPDEGSISAVQLLVVHFYDHTNSAEEVKEARKQLFTLKGRAMVFIPPTQAALQKSCWLVMFGDRCLFWLLICLLLHTDLIKHLFSIIIFNISVLSPQGIFCVENS